MNPTTPTSLITVMTPITLTIQKNNHQLPVQAPPFRKLRKINKCCKIKLLLCGFGHTDV